VTLATRQDRDRFLDLLRLVAVVRVVALHTCTKPPVVYLPWIQWIFPGMAEVFFVSGVVTAASLQERGGIAVVRARLRRLLPPFYAYAVVALGVMAVTDARSASPDASLDRGDFLSFLFPVVRPTGSVTRVVLWGHLWFLTAFLWVLVFAPLTFWLHRRIRAWSLVLPAVGFAVTVWAAKLGGYQVREEFYNVFMFGWFFQLGYLYENGWLQKRRPMHLAVVGVALFGLGWLVAERIEPVWKTPVNELYTSPTAHFLVGAAWMIGVLAVRKPIAAWLATRRLRAIDLITQRTYTLFIWGPAANAVAMAASRKVGGANGNLPLYLAVTALMLVALVLAFGWIEDLASRRPARLLPV
jgi:peptidoglycan-N-acetylglucosamine deacetylase